MKEEKNTDASSLVVLLRLNNIKDADRQQNNTRISITLKD